MSNRTRWLRKIAAACLVASSAAAIAAYPERPVTLIVPFAPGGSSDIVGRSLAQPLSERLGQSIVIENLGGAGGTIGTQKAVRAKPDGYTVLLGSGSEILINKIINPKTPYDATKDLAPLAFVGTGPMVLVAKTSLPANSIDEVLTLARAKPDSLSYGSAGNGTPMHVAGELLKIRGKVAIVHVPYKGAAPALTDLVGGQIDLAVSTLSAALPHIRSGKVKAIAVTSAKRTDLAPEIPTIAETKGLEGFDLGVWFGLFAPAGTPSDVTRRLQAETQAVVQDPAVRKRLAEVGISPSGASGADLAKFMATETDTYRKVVEAAKIVAE
ncbi:MAG: tripartite tricarboxylate transporter substrate binding protein [Burkholderiales bacterium]|nr:tripartite tricarboxylate transporter substrate binding protein [Burkholderiales bacterium]